MYFQFLALKEKENETLPPTDEGGDVDDLVSTIKTRCGFQIKLQLKGAVRESKCFSKHITLETLKSLSQKRATWNDLFAIVKLKVVCYFMMVNTMLQSNIG